MNQAATLRHNFEIAPEEEAFFAFIAEHFNSFYYLGSYSDVAEAGVDPLEHWLNAGFKEGRQISNSIVLRYGKVANRSTNRNWRHYRWRGEDIAVRLIEPIPPDVVTQILNQARHDPEVLAAGQGNTGNLGHRESVGPIDVAGLQRAIPNAVEFLVLAPNLGTGDDQKLTTNVVDALNVAGFRSIQTLVVDQESPVGFDESHVPEPFRATNVRFWLDFSVANPGLARLAQFIRLLRPRATIVANTRDGREIVAQFGRALSERTRLFCIYTSSGSGHEIDVRFPRRTLPFATGLTDDSVLAAGLRDQFGDVLGHEAVLLPSRLQSPAAFHDAVMALFGPP
jgi:hypothetical protein